MAVVDVAAKMVRCIEHAPCMVGAPSLDGFLAPSVHAWRRLDELDRATLAMVVRDSHWAVYRDCRDNMTVCKVYRIGYDQLEGQVRIRRPGEPTGWESGTWVHKCDIVMQPALLR